MKQAQLQKNESLIFSLRELYDSFGYSRYKMNKFEEYDLYAKNKDFLISDGVITFTDTNGKLMALKPDVTLSIVKNTKDTNTVQKVYYNENVYRVSKGTHSFKEITQVGLEAIGKIDEYCIYEVISLAAQSLACTEKNAVLEISHLGILSDVMEYVGIPKTETNKAIHFIGEKNVHELLAFCDSLGVAKEKSDVLTKVVKIYGKPEEVLTWINDNLKGIASEENVKSFEAVVNALSEESFSDKIYIDFSVVDDLRYYNGFVFKGFLEGIPTSVLSGGQYDALMKNMKRKSGAIGFAVYLDEFQSLNEKTEYDVDTILIYESGTEISLVKAEAQNLMENGESVLVQTEIPEDIKYKKLMKIINGEVKNIETNA